MADSEIVEKNNDKEQNSVKPSGKPFSLGCSGPRPVWAFHGRKQIFTSAKEINAGNVVDVLEKALNVHRTNRAEIQYLYDYLNGKQPICYRQKAVNGDICNRIVINRANEIVTFKTANFVGEPVQYVSRGTKEDTPGKIEQLNSMMLSENKSSKDMTLAYWMFTAGVGYRLSLRDKAAKWQRGELFDEAPFEIYTLDPRNTFVVRSADVAQSVVMAVNYVFTGNGSEVIYTCYTEDSVFTILSSGLWTSKLVDEEKNNMGMIPIIEYPCNSLRMGAFEVVIDLLDAINTTESNRLDGVEQFIQALMIFEGVDITREQLLELKDLGAIMLPPAMDGKSSSVRFINQQLDQGQTQVLADALYQEVLQIVGMPSQGLANTNDSSNNGAVIMKNGWWNAEARARETEWMFRQSETDFLKLILKVCRDTDAFEMSVSDIQIKFLPHTYEDKLTKVQSFTTLMGANVPPEQAYQISGVVADPESAAMNYEAYQERKEDELAEFTAKVADSQKRQINSAANADDVSEAESGE